MNITEPLELALLVIAIPTLPASIVHVVVNYNKYINGMRYIIDN